MAGRGASPKKPEHRQRTNSPSAIRVEKPDALMGPDLPDGVEWPPETVQWWHNWRSSPQSAEFTPTDWDFLLETALLHGLFWSGRTDVAAELRLRVAKVGATVQDRRSLGMVIETSKPDDAGSKGGSVLSIAERLQAG